MRAQDRRSCRPAGASCLRAGLVVALVLLAGTTRADELRDTLDRADFTAGQEAELAALFRDAEADGLPADALLPRLQEGIAKRVPFERVRDALAVDAVQLRNARAIISALEGGAAILEDSASWMRAANMLAAGHPDTVVRQLASACVARPASFRRATVLYVSLVDWGLASEPAVALTGAAVSGNVDPEDYPEVAAILARASRNRMGVPDAAQRLTEYLNDGRTLRQIERLLGR